MSAIKGAIQKLSLNCSSIHFKERKDVLCFGTAIELFVGGFNGVCLLEEYWIFVANIYHILKQWNILEERNVQIGFFGFWKFIYKSFVIASWRLALLLSLEVWKIASSLLWIFWKRIERSIYGNFNIFLLLVIGHPEISEVWPAKDRG